MMSAKGSSRAWPVGTSQEMGTVKLPCGVTGPGRSSQRKPRGTRGEGASACFLLRFTV